MRSSLPSDAWLLFASRIVRLFAYGFLSIILALHLAAVGMTDQQIGFVLTLTLVGDAALSLLVTQIADRIGRRRLLIASASLMIFAGATFAMTSDPRLLVVAAFIGTLSPTGHEAGPFLPLEQAALAQLIPGTQRTRVFAWYNLAGSFAAALGAWSGGICVVALQNAGLTLPNSYHMMFASYAGFGLLMGVVFSFLSPCIEVENPGAQGSSRFFGLHRSWKIIRNLSILFAWDSFAGALVLQSLLAYWFSSRFAVDPVTLGQLFFGANILAGCSALVAARVAARIGLINTMAFTHLPANVFLLLTPLMPTFPLAAAMVLLRYSTAQMDVPTRQAYLMAVVAPDERSAAAGVTALARTIASAFGPVVTGVFFSASLLNMPFFLAGGIKIVYDLALYWNFRHIKPPEER